MTELMSPPPIPGVQRPGELIERSRRLFAEGRKEEANVVAMLATRLHPEDADSHLHQATILGDLGRASAALEAIRAGIAAVPGDARLRERASEMLWAAGEFEAAVQEAAEAVTLAPEAAAAADRLGSLLQELGQFDRAALCHADAFDRSPGEPAYLCRLAVCMLFLGGASNALEALDHAAGLAGWDGAFDLHRSIALHLIGRHEDALVRVQELIGRTGGDLRAYLHLGAVSAALGRLEEAAAAYDMAALQDEGNPRSRFIALQWLDPKAVPTDAVAYVTAVLDPATAAYEDHALEVHRLRVPGLIEHLLNEVAETGRTLGRVLDLGCRTGLVGLVLAPRAGHLCGIDSEPALLRVAASKGLYHEIRAGDPSRALAAPQEPWDMIVTQDLPATVGDLGPLASAVAARLAPGGLWLLATEAGFLNPVEPAGPGRFRHSFDHVETAAANAGLDVVALHSDQLRLDGGFWVEGWLVALRRPTD